MFCFSFKLFSGATILLCFGFELLGFLFGRSRALFRSGVFLPLVAQPPGAGRRVGIEQQVPQVIFHSRRENYRHDQYHHQDKPDNAAADRRGDGGGTYRPSGWGKDWAGTACGSGAGVKLGSGAGGRGAAVR